MESNEKYVIFGEEEGELYILTSDGEKSLPQSLLNLPLKHFESFNYGDESFTWAIADRDKALEDKWLPIDKSSEFDSEDQAIICHSLGKLWPLFRKTQPYNLSLDNKLITHQNENEEQLSFYGGTFFPWHRGHEECLSLCPEKNIMVILDTNPFKDPTGRSQYMKDYFELFQEMKRLSKKWNKNFMLYPGFFAGKRGNPTASWLPNMRVKNKMMLLGDDNFKIIEKWHNYKFLLENLHTLYVVPRVLELKESEDLRSKLLKDFPGLRIEILSDHPYKDLSSTSIREEKLTVDK